VVTTYTQEEMEGAVAALSAQFPHPVLELIKRRLKEGSQPGRRRDTALLALVVEGGGMRGAVSAGGLQALHDLNMRCGPAPCVSVRLWARFNGSSLCVWVGGGGGRK
jgi:predicted acylesterase/phospholipase RssA